MNPQLQQMGPYVRQMMQVRRAFDLTKSETSAHQVLFASAVGAVPESPHQSASDAECDADDGRRWWYGRRRGCWTGRDGGHVPSAGGIRRRRRRRSRNWIDRGLTLHSGSASRRRSKLGGRDGSEFASGAATVQPVRDAGRSGCRGRTGTGSGRSATGLCAGDGADAAAVWWWCGRRRRRRGASWAVSGGAICRKSILLHHSCSHDSVADTA